MLEPLNTKPLASLDLAALRKYPEQTPLATIDLGLSLSRIDNQAGLNGNHAVSKVLPSARRYPLARLNALDLQNPPSDSHLEIKNFGYPFKDTQGRLRWRTPEGLELGPRAARTLWIIASFNPGTIIPTRAVAKMVVDPNEHPDDYLELFAGTLTGVKRQVLEPHHYSVREVRFKLAGGPFNGIIIEQPAAATKQNGHNEALRNGHTRVSKAVEALDTKVNIMGNRATPTEIAELNAFFNSFCEDRYEALCNFFKYRLNGQTDRAEELAQETLTKIWIKINQGEVENQGEEGFKGFCFRVARNLLIDLLRSKAANCSVPISEVFEQGHLYFWSSDPNFIQSEARAVIAPALAGLTSDQREVIELRFLQSYAILETARELGKTEGAAKKLQARALNALKKSFGLPSKKI